MVHSYALIKNAFVVNVIKIDEGQVSNYLSGTNYDEAVQFEPAETMVVIGDAYANGVFTRTLPSLANAKALKVAEFRQAAQDFIDAGYDSNTRQQLMNMYTLAKFEPLLNRAAYLENMLLWINSIISYSVTVSSGIMASNNVPAVLETTWDFAANTIADPKVRLGTAIAILD